MKRWAYLFVGFFFWGVPRGQRSCRWLHTEVTRMLAAGLPFLGRSLPTLLAVVVPQMCLNLESLLLSSAATETGPPDYLVTELEALTALCHYALIDASNSGAATALAGSAGLLSGLSWSTPINGTVGDSTRSSGQAFYFEGFPIVSIELEDVKTKLSNATMMSHGLG